VLIERKFGRDVESLVKGKTRMRVRTDMPGFEGGWMEARDVMEYLGMRSCCIGPAPAMRKDDVDQALNLSCDCS
jgi:hypothetical protein